MKEPEINLNGWVTISKLAADKKCTPQHITNQIRTGKIPFRILDELNFIRLVPGLEMLNTLNSK